MFDSGVGGLSVLTRIRQILPDADLTYVADRARAPYGQRSLEEVEAISIEIGTELIERGATCLVVACNTASAAALETLRDIFTVPIVGMEPAVKPAALASRAAKVAVVATEVTFQGRLFESVVSRYARDIEVMTAACPHWVEMVESGVTSGARAESEVDDVLGPMVAAGADVVVLGCTHFSFLSGVIRDLYPVEVIDPAPAVAAQTARVAPDVDGRGSLSLCATGDLDEFARLAAALAGMTEPVIPFDT